VPGPKSLTSLPLRGLRIARRYGWTTSRFLGHLEGMQELCRRYEAPCSFPLPAVLLARHPFLADRLRDATVLVHGLFHLDYAELDSASQQHHLTLAKRLFERHQLLAKGFRAPYLSIDATLEESLRETGYEYDSSRTWILTSHLNALPKSVQGFVKAQYRPSSGESASPPQTYPMELPVALPDDEIMIDRLHYPEREISRTLLGLLEQAEPTRGAVVLQLHPERFPLFRSSLETVLSHARDRGWWLTDLDSLADHIRHRPDGVPPRWPGSGVAALAVSGDIDGITSRDFLSRGSLDELKVDDIT